MAASGDFFTGDGLDDLFSLIDGGFLDDDDEFNGEINAIANEVTADEGNIPSFKCDKCEKVCKSQRGLTRHTNTKHPVVVAAVSDDSLPPSLGIPADMEVSMKKLHPIKLMCMVRQSAEKISKDLCFPLLTRAKFSPEYFSFDHADAETLWHTLRPIIDKFNGDAESFYSKFYALFIDNLLPESWKV